MRSINRKTLCSVLCFAAIGASACAGNEPAESPSDVPLKKVSMILGFLPSGSDAPYFVAQEKGFFEDRGLEVEILPGESSAVSVTTVSSGDVEFGVSDLTSVVLAKSQEPSTPVTAVTALQARAPYTIVSLESGANLAEPKDLEGAEVYLSATSTIDEIVEAWAARQGVTGIVFRNVNPAVQHQLLLNGRIPALSTFVTSLPDLEKSAGDAGEELVSLALAEYGLDGFYGNTLIANDDFAAQEPELTQGMVDAVLEGYEYSFAHPDEAAEITAELYPTVLPDSTVGRVTALEGLTTDGGRLEEIGQFEPERVEAMLEFLRESLGVSPEITAEDILSYGFAGQ